MKVPRRNPKVPRRNPKVARRNPKVARESFEFQISMSLICVVDDIRGGNGRLDGKTEPSASLNMLDNCLAFCSLPSDVNSMIADFALFKITNRICDTSLLWKKTPADNCILECCKLFSNIEYFEGITLYVSTIPKNVIIVVIDSKPHCTIVLSPMISIGHVFMIQGGENGKVHDTHIYVEIYDKSGAIYFEIYNISGKLLKTVYLSTTLGGFYHWTTSVFVNSKGLILYIVFESDKVAAGGKDHVVYVFDSGHVDNNVISVDHANNVNLDNPVDHIIIDPILKFAIPYCRINSACTDSGDHIYTFTKTMIHMFNLSTGCLVRSILVNSGHITLHTVCWTPIGFVIRSDEGNHVCLVDFNGKSVRSLCFTHENGSIQKLSVDDCGRIVIQSCATLYCYT